MTEANHDERTEEVECAPSGDQGGGDAEEGTDMRQRGPGRYLWLVVAVPAAMALLFMVFSALFFQIHDFRWLVALQVLALALVAIAALLMSSGRRGQAG